MRSPIPEDIKRWIIADRQRQLKDDARKRRLYNRYFRKSLFYISSLVVRAAYFVVFVIVFLNYNTTSFSRPEIYEQCWNEQYGGGRNSRTFNYLKTNYGSYHLSTDFRDCGMFDQDEPVMVEYNVFHKPIHFYQQGWEVRYGIYKNYLYYYILLFATFLTFFFNDGLDRFTIGLLYGFYALDLISVVAFFVL